MEENFDCFSYIFSLQIASSQILKFRTYNLSYKTKGSYGWSKWSATEDNSILIIFDLTKERVTIYSKTTQTYDIYKTYSKVVDKDGDDVYEYACIDAEGLKRHVRWIVLNSDNKRIQIYVDFSDMMWMYNVNLLD